MESGRTLLTYCGNSHYNAVKNEDALNRYIEQTQRCYGVLEGQLKKTDGKR